MLYRLGHRSLFGKISQIHNVLLQHNVKYFNSDEGEQNKEDMIGMFTQIHSRKLDKVSTRKPALPYDKLLSIETPSLLINMKQLQDNIESMNKYIDNNDTLKRIRPNTNIHKSSDIIQTQHKMHQERMDGICCSTINEAELLINSASNFLAPSSAHKIHDVLLSNICIDLSKMWRFVQLYDTTVLNMKLSTFMDDIFQIHLWNYTMEEFKKTNQNILHRHTSTFVGDTSMHSSNQLRLGVMLVLKSTNSQIGININDDTQIQSLIEILNTINNEYSNNLYLRGFYMDQYDDIARDWLLNKENINKINVNNFDDLYIANINEIYDDEYIFDHSALTILCTISNIYYDKDKYIHLLDIGYNSFSNIPSKIAKYHPPKYVIDNPPQPQYKLDEYEIINNDNVNPQHNTLLISNEELDVGGKIELVPNGYNATINLYNYFISMNDEKQIVDGIWQIDSRGPGN